ncbi:MAG TPA: hypothetical protein VF794_34300 [Archangium sp.]|jgi:hypothetical protein|uniref:hypothetical protein n=1 Tax=Archangium sp. TaxID=1872627 RepID=UPI002ED84EB9
MSRLHLFELEDQPWLPAVLRRGVTDYLAFVAQIYEAPYRELVRRLKGAMEAMGERRILDLASGGSGPVRPILRLLEEREHYPAQATLSDLYPDLAHFEHVKAESGGRIDFLSTPVDATAVPAELEGFRLMCNSFHHLPPEVARNVLADAVAKRRGIAIFELVERSPGTLLITALAPLNVLLSTPLMRPWRLDRFVFTYLLPLIPFVVVFDGLVSCLRVYSVEEMKALTEGLGDGDYQWEIDRVRAGPLHIHLLIGRPVEPRARG